MPGRWRRCCATDRFALATIVFRLLNFGIHPYSGVAKGDRRIPEELAARIRQHLYAYAFSAHPRLGPVPASTHHCLPPALRELFDRAFSAQTRSRPSAADWIHALQAFARRDQAALVPCDQGHLHFAQFPCPLCVRGGLLQGHAARRQRFLARAQLSPKRVARYVRNTIRGTQVSPFQAALAQAQWQTVQLAPNQLPLHQAYSIEFAWIAGLLISIWWLK